MKTLIATMVTFVTLFTILVFCWWVLGLMGLEFNFPALIALYLLAVHSYDLQWKQKCAELIQALAKSMEELNNLIQGK